MKGIVKAGTKKNQLGDRFMTSGFHYDVFVLLPEMLQWSIDFLSKIGL